MKRLQNPIFVTQPALPPLKEFESYLKRIWKNKIITNNGPFHQEFEHELSQYLGVKHISVFTNGTMALMTAIQALKISGEVITTPFSFVATTHSLWWNNIKPVFSDIEPEYFTLDPSKLESAITPNTTAIMPVHVYGNPCLMEDIQKIADTYGLKVIYDSAHAFAVKKEGDSILNNGDLSILSFHATKVFNSIEGGAIVSPDEKAKKRIDFLKNFGFANEVTVIEPGINAKMNELQAAYGLLQLKYIDEYIQKRKLIATRYRANLASVEGITLLIDLPDIEHNYSYFPILVDLDKYGKSRDELYGILKSFNIYGRRYFYPLISQFPSYRWLESAAPGNLPVAERVSSQVICLPIYPDLDLNIVDLISEIIIRKGGN
jgi:dTDP-4-amino-4,6-dideoxygalactose transaminase